MRVDLQRKEIGTAKIIPDADVPAASKNYWRIEYTVGEQEIIQGGCIRFEIPFSFTMPQLSYPDEDGYTQVECSSETVKLGVTLSYPDLSAFGKDPARDCRRWGRPVFVFIESGKLIKREKVILHYGIISREGLQYIRTGNRKIPDNGEIECIKGLAEAQYFSGEVEFWVGVCPDGKYSAPFSGYYAVCDPPKLNVTGSDPDFLYLTLPSLLKAGEQSTMNITLKDKFENPVKADKLRIHVKNMEGAEVPGSFVLDDNSSLSIPPIRFSSPGIYYLTAENEDASVSGRSNPMIVNEELEKKLYWGDLHVHSICSDGRQRPAECFRYARDDMALDFMALADHIEYTGPDDWEEIKEAVKSCNEDGKFVSILGFEHSFRQKYGDKCIYFPSTDIPYYCPELSDREEIKTHEISDCVKEWKKYGALMIAHDFHTKFAPNFYDEQILRLLEISSIWGASEEENGYRFVRPASGKVFIRDVLNRGWKTGLISSTDGHSGRAGNDSWLRLRQEYRGAMLGVYADELSRKCIFKSLWDRNCYGTTGERIILEFRINDIPMGGELTAETGSSLDLFVNAAGTEKLKRIDIIRNGENFYSWNTCSWTESINRKIRVEGAGTDYYYVRVIQENYALAWSSPIWINKKQAR